MVNRFEDRAEDEVWEIPGTTQFKDATANAISV